MESTLYLLTRPGKFRLAKKNVVKKKGYVLVEPYMASICNADLRYYTGQRRKEALKKKLPMALLHEGIGRVVDPNKNKGFRKGDRVVIVPCIPGYIANTKKFPSPKECCPACENTSIGENHCINIHFLSSGTNGLAQNLISHPQECLLRIPKDVPDNVACLSELLSVCYGAIKNENFRNKKVAVIGDGPVAYIFTLGLIFFANVKKANITVLGIKDKHLSNFDFVKRVNTNKRDVSKYRFDVLFECVGGKEAKKTINQAITLSSPGAKIFLIGVSENFVPINTRDILEKKISLAGVSRSSRFDYSPVISILKQKRIKRYIARVIERNCFLVVKSEDLNRAFSFAAKKNKYWGKILLKFKRAHKD